MEHTPVTRAELHEELTKLEAKLDTKLEALTDTLTEKMRDMQTEILRGFEAWSAPQSIRLRKLEADQSNLDSSVSKRMDILETRLFEIEKRLHITPPEK